MLVLSRQRGQSVMIGNDVEMKIVDVRGDKVRLGFVAPQSIQIHRKEIFDEIARETWNAAQLKPNDLQPAALSSQKGSTNMDPFLRAAIDQAKKGLSEGGLPIGSVLVRNGQIIAAGHNRRVQHGDPMAHAEIDCLTQAGRQSTYRDTVLYSTLMPCFLCSGAVVQFGIPKVIVGESVTFPGGQAKAGSSPEFLRSNGVEVIDLHDSECIDMMSTFIREHPQLWNEDIGR
ncbi:MAG TPA: carbon storage regulator CsrA [Tepidisphaeraceae bacterium]